MSDLTWLLDVFTAERFWIFLLTWAAVLMTHALYSRPSDDTRVGTAVLEFLHSIVVAVVVTLIVAVLSA